MKTLLLLRHAKSSWKNESLGDHDRPLNKRGKRDAPRMGRLLLEKNLLPDLILTSTAKRARKTARKVASACAYQGRINWMGELYHAEPEEIRALLAGLGSGVNTVLVVGHNPGLEECLRLLGGGDEIMPTAALAHLEADITDWMEILRENPPPTRFKALWKPRELFE